MSFPEGVHATPQLVSPRPAVPEDRLPTKAAASRRWSAALGAGLLTVYAALGVTAVLDLPVPFLVLLLLSQCADAMAARDDYVRAVLARAQFGLVMRSLVRAFCTVALLLGDDWSSRRDRQVAALLVTAVAGLQLVLQLVLVPVRRRAQVPVEARGVDLTGLRLPPAPSPLLLDESSERSSAAVFVAVAGAAVAVVTSSTALADVVVGAVLVAGLLALAVLGRALLAGMRSLSDDQLLKEIAARLARRPPEVMLYHSGEPDSAYQVNMWLSTIDALPRSCVVVLRERGLISALVPSRTPVVCIPDSVHFMTFPLPDVRVALYTANVGKTIHMLREPGVHHVFIGHGDSDKSASSNPFSKVYTEIWVAGQAGRDRYRRAQVGIHDDDIVEVGRPQLEGIDHFSGAVPTVLTVLYAPTWEGWTNDPAHTSIVRAGPTIVERLLSHPDVRVLYKPHPLTGTVSRRAAGADARIRALVERAGGPHRTVVGAQSSLYDCFNSADVLVADVSSVITDFVESQKPYVVPNLTSEPDAQFRADFPSVSAGYLLDGGGDQILEVIEQIRAGDPMADQRRELKHYLLGPDEPSARVRFAQAVDNAFARAVANCPVRPVLGAARV